MSCQEKKKIMWRIFVKDLDVSTMAVRIPWDTHFSSAISRNRAVLLTAYKQGHMWPVEKLRLPSPIPSLLWIEGWKVWQTPRGKSSFCSIYGWSRKNCSWATSSWWLLANWECLYKLFTLVIGETQHIWNETFNPSIWEEFYFTFEQINILDLRTVKCFGTLWSMGSERIFSLRLSYLSWRGFVSVLLNFNFSLDPEMKREHCENTEKRILLASFR